MYLHFRMGGVLSMLCDGSTKLEDEDGVDRLVHSTTKTLYF